MKYLISFFILIGFVGCDDNLLTKIYHPPHVSYKIIKIQTHYDGHAQYRASTGNLYFDIENAIEFVDSIGKYKIGDKLYVTFEKATDSL